MPLPKEIKGTYFTEIIPYLIPEIPAKGLVTLGAYIIQGGKGDTYQPLKASLSKIQWVKFTCLRAIEIENELQKMVKPNSVIFWPLGQTDHVLNITNCVVHTKSALDSIAVFLTSYLKLGFLGGDRDLKKGKFRDAVIKKDKKIGRIIKDLIPWLSYLQEIRDELIHRSSLRTCIINGPSDVGMLPIFRNPTLFGQVIPNDMKIDNENFYTTDEYVTLHFMNLVRLFRGILKRCIEIEKKRFKGKLDIPDKAEESMAFFPTRITQKIMLEKMIMGPSNIAVYFGRTR